LLHTQSGNKAGQQRLIIDIGGRPDADLSVPFRIGEVFIGRKLVRVDLVFRIDNHACPQRQTHPVVFWITIQFRDSGQTDPVGKFLKEALLKGTVQTRGIYSQKHIRGTVFSFNLKTLDQGIRITGNDHDGQEHDGQDET